MAGCAERGGSGVHIGPDPTAQGLPSLTGGLVAPARGCRQPGAAAVAVLCYSEGAGSCRRVGEMGSALLTHCQLAVMVWGGTYSLRGTFRREWCILKLSQLLLATNSCIALFLALVWI